MKHKIIGFVAVALLVSSVPLVSSAATLEERVDTLINRVDTLLDSLEGGMVLGASISSSNIQGLTDTVNSLISKTKTLLESGTKTAAPYVPPTPVASPPKVSDTQKTQEAKDLLLNQFSPGECVVSYEDIQRSTPINNDTDLEQNWCLFEICVNLPIVGRQCFCIFGW